MSTRGMVARVVSVKRAGNDRHGNPSFVVEFAGGIVYRTEPGSQVGFEIENHVGHLVHAEVERGHIRGVRCPRCEIDPGFDM